MRTYRAGTLTLVANSDVITGVGTAFIANVAIGDIVICENGQVFEVAAVTDDTHLKVDVVAKAAGSFKYGCLRFVTAVNFRDLSIKIEQFLSDRQKNLAEFTTWMTGTRTGGPASNGYYPLTDRYGVTNQYACPALLAYGYENAVVQANNAAASATAANTSKTAAATSATAAATSATNAKTSETNSKTSETNSKTSETNSKASETAAAASKTAAATSETNANTSKNAAATSATNAATSATQAAASAAAAATIATDGIDKAPNNLVANPNFAPLGSLVPAAVSANSTVSYLDITDASVPAGMTGYKVAVFKKNTANQLAQYTFPLTGVYSYIPVVPGEKLDFTVVVGTTGNLTTGNSTCRIVMVESTKDGTFVQNSRVLAYDNVAGGVQKLSGVFTASATTYRVTFAVWSETAMPVNGTIYMSEPYIAKRQGMLPQATLDDATVNQFMLTGAFGLGGASIAIGSGNIDTLNTTGFYYTTTGVSLGTYPSGATTADFASGMLIHIKMGTAASQSQILMNRDTNVMWYRGMASSAWKPWQQLATENSVQTALGLIGLSNNVDIPVVADLNLQVVGGSFRWNGTSSNLPLAGSSGVVYHGRYNVNSLTQIAVVSSPTANRGETYIRACLGGSWSAWTKFASEPFVNNLFAACGVGVDSSPLITDCNSPTLTGFYRLAGGGLNKPFTPGGLLQHVQYTGSTATGNAMQQYTAISTTASLNNLTACRVCSNGTWSAWKTLAVTDGQAHTNATLTDTTVAGTTILGGELKVSTLDTTIVPSANNRGSPSTNYTPKIRLSGNVGNNETILAIQGYSFSTYDYAPTLVGTRSLGSVGQHTAIPSGRTCFAIIGAASDGAAYQPVGRIDFVTSGATTPTDSAGEIRFLTTPAGGIQPTLAGRFLPDGGFEVSGDLSARNLNTSGAITRTGSGATSFVAFRNNSDSNSFYQAQTNAGSVFFGNATGTVFAINDAANNSGAWCNISATLASFKAEIRSATATIAGNLTAGSLTTAGVAAVQTLNVISQATCDQMTAAYRMCVYRNAGIPYMTFARSDLATDAYPSSNTAIMSLNGKTASADSNPDGGRALGSYDIYYTPAGGGLGTIRARSAANSITSEIYMDGNAGQVIIKTGELVVNNGMSVSGLANFAAQIRGNQYLDLGYQNTTAGARAVTFYSGSNTTATANITVTGTTAANSIMVINASNVSVTADMSVTGVATFGAQIRGNQYLDLGYQNTTAGSRNITFYSGSNTTATGSIIVTGTTAANSTMVINAGTVSITANVTLSTALPVASGGTGVTTLAALQTALNGVGSYSRANIIGTVSQASGVPTGAIIETATNANGTYTKYADGTMICSTQVTFGSLASNARLTGPTRNWPAAFVSKPYVAVSPVSSYPDQVSVGVEPSYTTSQLIVTATNRFASAAITDLTVHAIATGRWY